MGHPEGGTELSLPGSRAAVMAIRDLQGCGHVVWPQRSENRKWACNCSEEGEAGKAVQAGSSGQTRDGAGEDSVGVPGGKEGIGIWWGPWMCPSSLCARAT